MLAASLTLTGCATPVLDIRRLPFVYRIDVQQGNVVTQEMLAQLKPGMEKNKVRYIMGSPLVVDVFHEDRWDYLYSFQSGSGQREQRRVTLYFKDDRLASIDGNVRAAQTKLEMPARRDNAVEVEGEYKKPLLARMAASMGLGDKEPAADAGAAQADSAADTSAAPAAGAPQPTDANGAANVSPGASPPEAPAGTSDAAAATADGATTADAAPPAQDKDKDGTTTSDAAGTPAPAQASDKDKDDGKARYRVPDEPPPSKKGFFGRLLERVGIGDNEDAKDYQPIETRHQDPSNPQGPSAPQP